MVGEYDERCRTISGPLASLRLPDRRREVQREPQEDRGRSPHPFRARFERVFIPVMGLLFLRHVTSRYDEARVAIKTDQATAKIPQCPQVQAAFIKRGQYGVPTDEAITRIDGTNSSRQVEL